MTRHCLAYSARRSALAVTLGLGLLVASNTRAALTWNNAGLSNNWSTAGGNENWLPGNVVWTNGEDAIFGATAETVTTTTTNIVDDISFGASWTIANGGAASINLTTDGNSDITVDPTFTSSIAEVISGTNAVTKLGSGTLIVSNTNTYTGATGVSAGKLDVSGSIATAASVSVTSGATLEVSGTAGFNRLPQGTGKTWTVAGIVTVTSSDVMTIAPSITLNGGTLTSTSAGSGAFGSFHTPALANTITANGTGNTISSLDFSISRANGTSLTLHTPLAGDTLNASTSFVHDGSAGTGGQVSKTGLGTVTLSGANTYTNSTTINAGTLQFAKQASLYNNTPASWTAANINVKSGATIAVNVDSAGTNGFTATNLNTLLTNISVAGSATAGLQAGAFLGFDTSTATGGTFTQGNAVANSTGANGGAIGVTKLGSGVLVFDKTNTYTGPTSITAGTLLVNGSLAAGSAVTVTGGILGGTGMINGTVAVNAATLAPGASPGTLTINNALSFGSASILAYELTAGNFTIGGGINDLVTGVNGLILDGTLNVTSSPLSAGTWRLINYSGSFTDNILSLGTINLAPLHVAAINTATSGQVDLVVSLVPEPTSFAMLAFGMISLWLFRKRS